MKYAFSLGDGKLIHVEMPHLHPRNSNSEENENNVTYKLTLQNLSARLVKNSESAPGAGAGPAAAGAGAGSAVGGRRKTRRGRKGHSLTRKQK